MRKVNRQGLRTWIEVDQKAIRHNFGVFKKLIPKRTKLMAVVKSNAYGHGLVDFAREMEKLGADFLGVDSMTEARALRREGITTPLLVLGYTMPELFEEAAEKDVSLCISTFENLDAIKKIRLKKPLKIHIKVDTGMHRQGFLLRELPKVLSRLKSLVLNHKAPSILIEGLFTHFAAAKNPAFPQDTKAQIAEFKTWVTAFRKAGQRPIVHAAAGAGTMLFKNAHFDMVRVGMGLYGLWPAHEVRSFFNGRIQLQPVLTWKSLLIEIKKLPKGSRIGYDFTETLLKDTVVGIVPVGYWHGYPRALSSIGSVLIGGKECRVLGRVSMDMISIDLSKVVRPKVGEEVIVMGGEDELPVSAAGLARSLDASWYEVITRVNPLIKRIYL